MKISSLRDRIVKRIIDQSNNFLKDEEYNYTIEGFSYWIDHVLHMKPSEVIDLMSTEVEATIKEVEERLRSEIAACKCKCSSIKDDHTT